MLTAKTVAPHGGQRRQLMFSYLSGSVLVSRLAARRHTASWRDGDDGDAVRQVTVGGVVGVASLLLYRRMICRDAQLVRGEILRLTRIVFWSKNSRNEQPVNRGSRIKKIHSANATTVISNA